LIVQPANDGGKYYSKIFCYLHSKAELVAIRMFTEVDFWDPTEDGIFDGSQSISAEFLAFFTEFRCMFPQNLVDFRTRNFE
jgi:hypothetical protein